MSKFDEMKAGRELDALVAEAVMGFSWVAWKHPGERMRVLAPPGWTAEYFTPHGIKELEVRPATGDEKPFSDGLRFVPPYSADATVALQVLEAARRAIRAFAKELHPATVGEMSSFQIRDALYPDPPFYVSLDMSVAAFGETVPEAICKAAAEAAAWLGDARASLAAP